MSKNAGQDLAQGFCAEGPFRLSVAMMAHRKREEQVEKICARLDRRPKIVWDTCDDRWDTGRRAMLAFDPAATHHAVIQDDVLVCRDLFAGVERALPFVPRGVPFCGYVGRVRPYAAVVTMAAEIARRERASWLQMHTLNWGPLIVVPTYLIPDMIAFCDPLKNIPNYDRRLSRFFELDQKASVWYTWPSLVDHADGVSLVPGRNGTDRKKAIAARVAHTFIGEDASALDVEWGGRVVDSDLRRIPPDARVLYRNKTTGETLRLRPTSPRVRRLQGLPSWELVRGL